MQGSRADEEGAEGWEWEEMRREKEQEGISRQRRSWLRKGAAGVAGEGPDRGVLGKSQLPLGSLLCPPGWWHFPSHVMSVAPGALYGGKIGGRKLSLSSPCSPLPEPPACCRSSSRFFACSPLHLHLFLVCFIISQSSPAPCHPHCTAPPSPRSPHYSSKDSLSHLLVSAPHIKAL